MSWPINTFVHPQPLRIQHRGHITRHDGPQRKRDTGRIQWFTRKSTQTCSEKATHPSPGLDTKINKHARYCRQFTRLVLENWHRRLIEETQSGVTEHSLWARSTSCHHFRWSGVKEAAHSPFIGSKQCFIHSSLPGESAATARRQL